MKQFIKGTTLRLMFLVTMGLSVKGLYGQYFEKSEDRGTYTIYHNALYTQDSILVVTGVTEFCGWNHFVQGIDPMGTILWEFNGSNQPLTNVLVFPNDQDQWVIFGITNGGDVVNTQPYFQIISSQGELLTEYSANDDFSSQNMESFPVAPVNIGNQIGFISHGGFPEPDYKLWSIGLDGATYFNISLGTSHVYHLLEFQGYFTVFTALEIMIISVTGEVVNSIPYPSFTHHVQALSNDKLLILGEDGFAELNEQFQISEVVLPVAPDTIVQCTYFDGKIYLMGIEDISIYDLNYALLNTIPHALLPHLYVTDFSCRTGQCAISGTRIQDPSTPSLVATAVVYTTPTNGEIVNGTNPDIALSSLYVISQNVNITSNPTDPVFMGFVSGLFEVYLVNKGDITIDKAAITSNYSLGFLTYCNEPDHVKLMLENLNLAPNDSILISSEYQTFFTVASSNSELNSTICAVASVPNDLSDRDAGNDMACSSIQTLLSSNDLSTQGLSKVFPNPNDGQFTLQVNDGGHALMDVQILDLSGKVLKHLRQVSTGQLINAGTLSPGLYILRATDGRRNYVDKLVIR